MCQWKILIFNLKLQVGLNHGADSHYLIMLMASAESSSLTDSDRYVKPCLNDIAPICQVVG